jgi:hypothetical protein
MWTWWWTRCDLKATATLRGIFVCCSSMFLSVSAVKICKILYRLNFRVLNFEAAMLQLFQLFFNL